MSIPVGDFATYSVRTIGSDPAPYEPYEPHYCDDPRCSELAEPPE